MVSGVSARSYLNRSFLLDRDDSTADFRSDSHWFNTVKIPRSAAEAFLGPKQLEARARNFYVLGMSLGMLFDISGAPEFLRALTRVLEEWEIMAEGGGSKVVSLVPYYS